MDYTNATGHYLSPGRRDPIKQLWEEPLNHTVIQRAVDALALPDGEAVRVLDVGCGTGDGLQLLRTALAHHRPGLRVDYVGMDPDPSMIATARSLHEGDGAARFVQGDVRTDLPDAEFDLYFSCGVPYSHLTIEDCRTAIGQIMRRVRTQNRRAGLVVDVLGRYSHEWTPRWDQQRWNYDMSFFDSGSDTTIDGMMSFYCRSSLTELLRDAAEDSGVTLDGLTMDDRSVVAGRHTSTQAFDPVVPPYRDLLNRLALGDTVLTLGELQLEPGIGRCPDALARFRSGLAAGWNRVLETAGDRERAEGVHPDSRREVAETLRRTEMGAQEGLGAGHTLIASMTIG